MATNKTMKGKAKKTPAVPKGKLGRTPSARTAIESVTAGNPRVKRSKN